MLEQNNLIKRVSQWETIHHDEILDSFPILSEQDIGDITLGKQFVSYFSLHSSFLGVFQLKRARSYVEERLTTSNEMEVPQYSLQRCRSIPNLIRVPTQSAHSTRTQYHPTIQFTANKILGWWCDCYTGARIVGCCSHVSSAIWFLSYERWQTQVRSMPSTDYLNIATDAIQVSDFYDSSDSDSENNTRYYLP